MIALLLFSAPISDAHEPTTAPSNIKVSASACEASLEEARAIIDSRNKKAIFTVWQGDAGSRFNPDYRYDWSPTDYGTREGIPVPSRELISNLKDNAELSAVGSCSNVRSYLSRRNISFGRKALEEAQNRSDQETVIVGLSLAIVDKSGNNALIRVGFSGLNGGGGGWVYMMTRDRRGAWRRAYTAPAWIA